MLIAASSVLTALEQDIASRARDVTDHNGKPVILPTISPAQLRSAAITALFIATGQVIWPADQKLDLRRERSSGPLNIEE